MKKKVLNGLLIGGISLLTLSSVAAVTLTSCADNNETPADTPAGDPTSPETSTPGDPISPAPSTPETDSGAKPEFQPGPDATPTENATIDLYNKYNTAVTDAAGNAAGFITSKKAAAVINVMDQYIKQANDLKTQIEKSGSVDEKIWINSVLFQMEIEKASVTTKSYLLGASIGGNILTAYSSRITRYANNVKRNVSPASWKNRLNTFTDILKITKTNFTQGIAEGTTMSGIMLKLFVSDSLKTFYGPQLETYLAKGTTAQHITSSNLITELGGSTFFQSFFSSRPESILSGQTKTELLGLAKNADALIDTWMGFLVNEFWQGVHYGWNTNTTTPDTFELSIVAKNSTGEATNTYEVDGSQENTIKGLGLTKKDLETKDIGIGFAPGTDKIKEPGLNIYKNYLLYKNTTLYKDAATVNSLGISNVDQIKTNMKGVASFLAPKLADKEATTWIPKGYTYDADIFDNKPSEAFVTKGLASKDENGVWTVSDEQLTDFFKWLNADQWFFGRDVAPNQVVTLPKEASGLAADIYFAPNNAGKNGQGIATETPNIIPEAKQQEAKTKSVVLLAEGTTTTPATPAPSTPAAPTPAAPETPKKYNADGAQYAFNMQYANELGTSKITDDVKNNFGDAGNLYQQYVAQAKGIAPGTANISGAQAYAGASFSMDSYYRLRDAILPKVTEIFVKSKDSNVHAPTELNLETNIITGVGGAAYASGGTFFLDVNPFYGLQKWSMTTLLSHESLPGHNLQMIYAVDNTSSQYAPELSYTSYAEGWGLFSEWLATQYGSYGQPAKITGVEWLDPAKRMQLPTFDDNAFDAQNKQFNTVNINVKQANADITTGEFMNGSYETDFEGLSTTDADSLDQGYYNAMQYFGFLNERQLRAMRMALDTSVHAGGPKIANGVLSDTKNANIGTAAKGTGWSLQDEMDFMHANSGLGQGDITREAQRYLNYTAQATSYLTGEIEIESLFGKASAAYAAKHDNALFMNYADLTSTQNNTAPFFNLILRNNDIPLKVLRESVEQYITENIGAIPTATPSTSQK